MFISLISLLIVEHLSKSEKFIEELNYSGHIVQSQLVVYNLKKEIIKYLLKNKEDVEKILDNEIFSLPITLGYGNISVVVNISNYQYKHNINLLNGAKNDINTTSEIVEIEELFINNGVSGFYEFKTLVRNRYISSKNLITSAKQFHSIIDSFIRIVRSNRINSIRDKLYFISFLRAIFLLFVTLAWQCQVV